MGCCAIALAKSMAQLKRECAVQVAVVRRQFGSLVRDRGAVRQFARRIAAENFASTTTPLALR
jgi:hypothetical protein